MSYESKNGPEELILIQQCENQLRMMWQVKDIFLQVLDI